MLINIRICSVSDSDSSSFFILLELFVVTPTVLPPTNCRGDGTTPYTLVGGVSESKAIKVDGFQQIVS